MNFLCLTYQYTWNVHFYRIYKFYVKFVSQKSGKHGNFGAKKWKKNGALFRAFFLFALFVMSRASGNFPEIPNSQPKNTFIKRAPRGDQLTNFGSGQNSRCLFLCFFIEFRKSYKSEKNGGLVGFFKINKI